MIPQKKGNWGWVWMILLVIFELIRRGLTQGDIFEELRKRFGMTEDEAKSFWNSHF